MRTAQLELNLWDIPHSAKNDPITSDMAADKLIQSGGMNHQCKTVYGLLSGEGMTSAELAYIGGLDRHLVARRLPDLEKLGYAERGEIRVCTVTKNKCVTWRLK